MPSRRLYPEPINTILRYSFYTLCYISRVWYYPKPKPEEVVDIEHWSPIVYNKYKRATVDFFDTDHEKFFNDDTFSTLGELLLYGNMVDKYERLHRIRWRRANDEAAYNDAKIIGFWSALIQHLKADF